jgi:purine-binding chemotaxis protein CheW
VPEPNGRQIDWEVARERLAEGNAALERALNADPQRLDRVLRQRAAQLAQRTDSQQAGEVLPVLVFALGGERYAVELGELAEVLPFENCTPIPDAPPEYAGVINLRGEIRLVVDLARLLQLPAESGAADHVLLLRGNGQKVGLKTGPVEGIRPLPLAELSDTAEDAPEHAAPFLRGLTGDLIALLRTEKILSRTISG